MSDDKEKIAWYLTGARVVLSALSFVKEAFLAFMMALVQYWRIKANKEQDQIILNTDDQKAKDETDAIQKKADATDPSDGIDSFLQR
jgi:Leu/Phe-tRNA-protein transferase